MNAGRARFQARRHLLSAAVVLVASSLSLEASAGDPKPDAAAQAIGREHFNRGVSLYKESDYRAALIEFTRAYEVAPNYRIQYNIATSCLELQDYSCALHAFEKYLQDGGADVPPARRASTEADIKRLSALVAHVNVNVNKPGAKIAIDDIVVGTSPLEQPLVVGAGRRRITATLAPLQPATKVIDVAGGDNVDVDLELVEAFVPPALALRPVTVADPYSPGGAPPPTMVYPSRAPFWISVAVTGLATASAITFGVLAVNAKSDLDKRVNSFGTTSSDLTSAQDRVRNFSLATDISGGMVVVGAALSTIFYFTTSPRATTRVGVTPGGLSLSKSF